MSKISHSPHPEDESSVVHAVRQWPQTVRLLAGLFLCALVAVYFSAIVITLSGTGPNTMTMWKALGMNMLFLMILNAAAYPKRIFWAVNGVFAAFAVGLTLVQMISMASPDQYFAWWKGYLYATSGPLINSFAFMRFCKVFID